MKLTMEPMEDPFDDERQFLSIFACVGIAVIISIIIPDFADWVYNAIEWVLK